MGAFINLIFFGISFVTLAIAGGFATNAAVRATQIPNWDTNSKLQSAHRNLTIAAIVTWITVAVILVLGILYLFFGFEETAEIPGVVSLIIYGFLFLSLAATAVVGVLSAIAAEDIAQANVSDDHGARGHAITAAVLAIVGFVGLLIVLLIRLFSKPEKKEGKKKKQEMLLIREEEAQKEKRMLLIREEEAQKEKQMLLLHGGFEPKEQQLRRLLLLREEGL